MKSLKAAPVVLFRILGDDFAVFTLGSVGLLVAGIAETGIAEAAPLILLLASSLFVLGVVACIFADDARKEERQSKFSAGVKKSGRFSAVALSPLFLFAAPLHAKTGIWLGASSFDRPAFSGIALAVGLDGSSPRRHHHPQHDEYVSPVKPWRLWAAGSLAAGDGVILAQASAGLEYRFRVYRRAGPFIRPSFRIETATFPDRELPSGLVPHALTYAPALAVGWEWWDRETDLYRRFEIDGTGKDSGPFEEWSVGARYQSDIAGLMSGYRISARYRSRRVPPGAPFGAHGFEAMAAVVVRSWR